MGIFHGYVGLLEGSCLLFQESPKNVSNWPIEEILAPTLHASQCTGYLFFDESSNRVYPKKK